VYEKILNGGIRYLSGPYKGLNLYKNSQGNLYYTDSSGRIQIITNKEKQLSNGGGSISIGESNLRNNN